MMKRILVAATAFASSWLVLSAAQAGGANRAWVSGHGADAAGCGAPTNPCRSFQYVHDNIVAAGGEIDILDPAGYGAVTISKALSIVNDGVGTAGVQATSGDAITINAGANDVVTLRGLNIDGLGTGANGIVFNSGGGLTVTDCAIRHFAGSGASGNGVLIQPTSGSTTLLISNVTVSDNGHSGVYLLSPSGAPNVTAAIDGLTALNNSAVDVFVDSSNATGGAVSVAMSDSIATSAQNGVLLKSAAAPLSASIDRSTFSNNLIGVYAGGTATVLLGRSVITSNSQDGVVNNTYPNTLYTYGDNRINGNGTDIPNALNTTYAQR